MQKVKAFLVENWRSKLISLFIALSIWYLIKSHLDSSKLDFPVPGTTPLSPLSPLSPLRPPSAPPLDDSSILGPLIPPSVPLPVPGGDGKG